MEHQVTAALAAAQEALAKAKAGEKHMSSVASTVLWHRHYSVLAGLGVPDGYAVQKRAT